LKILTILFLIPCTLFAERGYVEPWGQDAILCRPHAEHTPIKKLSPMGRCAEQAILFHHNVLTHISGPRSHFRPTSSQYMLQAIRKHGFVKGYLMGCDRLLRENGEEWHYRTRLIDNKLYKWDPPGE
jgi:putative component of membrane protein insertase Oxa1/YidC/SpoIIIJ protein YidD